MFANEESSDAKDHLARHRRPCAWRCRAGDGRQFRRLHVDAACLDVASDMGLATISHTQFAGDEWQVQGYDVSGRYMEVDVDVNTGEVLNVDR